MLSSTAKNLYWIGRYIERAENAARVLEAAERIALLSPPDAGHDREWMSVAAIYDCRESFLKAHEGGSLESLLHFMTLDADSATSIFASVRQARDNGRAERNNLTVDVWETLNGFWLELQAIARQRHAGRDWRGLLDWIKKQANLVTGAAHQTMLRDEAFSFLSLGTYIERADNTARILDVKYHILLPQGERIGGSVDYYHWGEILACISAYRTYRRVYASAIEPWRVAELMILNRNLPRSLHFAHRRIDAHLNELAEFHGQRHEAHRLAGELYAQLRYGKIDMIFGAGLHEFLEEFMERNAVLSGQIARDYLME